MYSTCTKVPRYVYYTCIYMYLHVATCNFPFAYRRYGCMYLLHALYALYVTRTTRVGTLPLVLVPDVVPTSTSHSTVFTATLKYHLIDSKLYTCTVRVHTIGT